MTERRWDGPPAAYRRPDNKVSLGFVEGLNNKMRVLKRRAYGLRDDEMPAPEGTHVHAAAVLIKNDQFLPARLYENPGCQSSSPPPAYHHPYSFL